MLNSSNPFAWRARHVRAGGCTVAVYEAGSDAADAPVVLLVHGLGHWTDAAWGRLVPSLRANRERRYVAFDLPGFGASEKPNVRYGAAFFRSAVGDLTAQLAPRPFALVGHSLGGFIAADWAGEHPTRVTHLALIAPAGFAFTSRFALYGILARGFGWTLRSHEPSRAFLEGVLRRAVADTASLDPAHVEAVHAHARDPSFRRALSGVYSASLETYLNRSAIHRRFARFTGPVFCAWGRQDRYIDVRSIDVVTGVYPHARTLILERSGHLPAVEQPLELAAALDAFLAA